MRVSRYVVLSFLAVIVHASTVHSVAITIRTGQVGGVPGSCSGADDSFHYYGPQTQCSLPLQSTPFQSTDFDMACNDSVATICSPYPAWTTSLACDPDARWITNVTSPILCYGDVVSLLYCADFNVASECAFADSVRVCWMVDDALGDPAGDGPNPGGVYINGTSLGSAFTGGSHVQETSAVAYNVPLQPGPNRLEVYQRDLGCVVAGLILSCTVYTDCGSVPVERTTWGSLKAIYRDAK